MTKFVWWHNNAIWGDRSSKRNILLCKKTISLRDVNVDGTAISKLFEIKTNCIRPFIKLLVLILPKMSR